jgi:hypothetical protein
MALGRTLLRKIVDLRTSEVVKHWYNGRELENIDEWPPRLSGCELAVSPQRISDFEEMAVRVGAVPAPAETLAVSPRGLAEIDELAARVAAALPHGAVTAPEPRTLRRRLRELVEKTFAR